MLMASHTTSPPNVNVSTEQSNEVGFVRSMQAFWLKLVGLICRWSPDAPCVA